MAPELLASELRFLTAWFGVYLLRLGTISDLTVPMAPVEQQSTIGPVAEAVARGECILFLGAGVHCAPPEGSPYSYPPEHRPPLGGQLSLALSAESDFAKEYLEEDERNLTRVSLHYERKFKRRKLVERVEQLVDENRRPSAAVLALASLPFPIIVTTNYDRIFERALQGLGKDPHVSVYGPDHSTPTADHKKFGLLTRICGLILALGAVPSCDKGRSP